MDGNLGSYYQVLPHPASSPSSIYFSSSSSMKPLLSLSRIWNTFFTSSGPLFFKPTIWKNFLWSKESAAVGRRGRRLKKDRTGARGKSCCSIKGHPHGCGEQEGRGSPARKGCSAQGRTFLVPPMHTLKSPMKTVGPLRTVFL